MSWNLFNSAVRSIFSQPVSKRRRGFRPIFDVLEDRVVPTSYATNFPLTENPISEAGNWVNGGTTGIDWGNVSTTPGYAVGHAGPARFADATALVSGTWGPDQTAQATVAAGAVFGAPEVELRLRSTLSAHSATGYEISESVAGGGNGSYLIIVRWNGPLANFTYLASLSSPQYSVTTGDVVKATIVGNVITAYKNGVVIGQATDSTFTSGSPGIGFNEGSNGEYGYSSFSATDGTTTTIPSVTTGLTASAANAQVSLNWNASAGATSYDLYRSTGTAHWRLYRSGVTSTRLPTPV